MLFLQAEEAPHGNELESEKGMLQGLSAQRAGGAGGDMVSRCKDCQQIIEWETTAQGKAIPLNPRVLTIIDAEGRTVRGRESHFANCPGAAEFRKAQ
jgi:hypothetical protein